MGVLVWCPQRRVGGGHLGEVCVIAGVVAPHHGCQEVRRGLG